MSTDRHDRARIADEPPSTDVIVLAPLALEARAVRAGAPWAQVHRIGMGPRRAARSAQLAGDADGSRRDLIAGFCGALDPSSSPATSCSPASCAARPGRRRCADPTILAGVLRRGGLRVHVGPIASSQRLVLGERRRDAVRGPARSRSTWSRPGWRPARAPPAGRRCGSCSTPSRRELHRPLRTLTGAATAYRALRRACALVEEWADALGAARGRARLAARLVRRRRARDRDRRAGARGARRPDLRAQADRPQRARRRRRSSSAARCSSTSSTRCRRARP